MRRIPLQLLLALLFSLFLVAPAQAQDARAERAAVSAFKRSLRTESSLKERQLALDALVAVGGEKALDQVLDTLDDLDRDLRKLDARIEKLGRRRADIWKHLDRQADKGMPVAMGQEGEKDMALTKEQSEQIRERRRELRWRDALIEGGAKLIDGYQNPEEALQLVEKQLKRAKSAVEWLPLVRMLGASATSQAADILNEMALTSDEADRRVAAIDAVASRRDPKLVPVLVQALGEEFLPARVAAIRGLAETMSLDAVGALVSSIQGVEGRVLDETVSALEDIVGTSKRNNTRLWAEWWQSAEAELREELALVSGDEASDRGRGLLSMAKSGSLVSILSALRQDGLDPFPGPKADPDAELPALKPGSDLRRRSVGQALSTLDRDLRSRAVQRTLITPLVRSAKATTRARWVRWLGRVRSERVLTILSAYSSERPDRNPQTEAPYSDPDREILRLAAIAALGEQERPEALPPLIAAAERFAGTAASRKAAIEAITSLGYREAVIALVELLRARDSSVKEAAFAGLQRLTGEAWPNEYRPWKAWADKLPKSWVPPGGMAPPSPEAAAEEGPRTGFYGIETTSKRILFVLDRSGSMMATDSAGADSRFALAMAELSKAIKGLPEDGSFNVIFYNHTHTTWRKRMTPANAKAKKDALDWLGSLDAAGNTNIHDPLMHAFALAGRGTKDAAYGVAVDTIFFMSDGVPNRGVITDPNEILNAVRRENALSKLKIHTIGVGNGHDRTFMRELAQITGGQYVAR